MFGRKNKNQLIPRRPASSVPARQNVFSYHANRAISETPRARKEIVRGESRWQTAFRRLKSLPVLAGTVVGIIALLYNLSLSTTPKVVILGASGRSLLRSNQAYQDYAASLSRSSLLNQSKLTIDTDGMAEKIKQQFPEIVGADVNVPLFGRRPVVELTAIAPSFVLASPSGRYFIATDGRVTADPAVYTSKPSDAVTVNDESGLPVKPGTQILTKETVAFINQVVMQMQAKGAKISSLTLPAAPFELRMQIEGAPYYVRFNTLGDPRIQSGAFLATKDYLDKEHQKPAEYIDVRVEDRAFYK